ncbi:hypothetical protein OROGR_018759 [Orobanche gracilis]
MSTTKAMLRNNQRLGSTGRSRSGNNKGLQSRGIGDTAALDHGGKASYELKRKNIPIDLTLDLPTLLYNSPQEVQEGYIYFSHGYQSHV